jgi:hypothetical protein
MGTWLMRWKSGDVTVISAPSKMDAHDFLEALGGAYNPSDMVPFTRGFAATFTVDSLGAWRSRMLSSSLNTELTTAYAAHLERKRRRGKK